MGAAKRVRDYMREQHLTVRCFLDDPHMLVIWDLQVSNLDSTTGWNIRFRGSYEQSMDGSVWVRICWLPIMPNRECHWYYSGNSRGVLEQHKADATVSWKNLVAITPAICWKFLLWGFIVKLLGSVCNVVATTVINRGIVWMVKGIQGLSDKLGCWDWTSKMTEWLLDWSFFMMVWHINAVYIVYNSNLYSKDYSRPTTVHLMYTIALDGLRGLIVKPSRGSFPHELAMQEADSRIRWVKREASNAIVCWMVFGWGYSANSFCSVACWAASIMNIKVTMWIYMGKDGFGSKTGGWNWTSKTIKWLRFLGFIMMVWNGSDMYIDLKSMCVGKFHRRHTKIHILNAIALTSFLEGLIVKPLRGVSPYGLSINPYDVLVTFGINVQKYHEDVRFICMDVNAHKHQDSQAYTNHHYQIGHISAFVNHSIEAIFMYLNTHATGDAN